MNRTPFFEEARTAHKWFPMDKNYILKEAQLGSRQELVEWTSRFVTQFYQLEHNPLGLVDETISVIQKSSFEQWDLLHPIYAKLAAIYRHKHGEVQLQFLFDGDDHFDKYVSEWQETFTNWLHELCKSRYFLRALLEITVFKNHGEHEIHLINNRLQSHIEHHFGLRIYRYRGIQELEAA